MTFNSEQQSLILDLLDKARAENPEIEWAFAEEAEEPVFVKNLETVQGDERDVILFSITYGPDQAGHVTMNFGPLNRDGGERRLNVAMTRARSEMVVFSTLSPEMIDLSRTNSEAVKHLKHFLEFAERGPSALGAAVHGSLGDFESPFETAVARALRDRGWSLHPQIGVSAFRIDIGIVHPDEPGVYLAGVECDGAMYHSSAYARERDKIRQAVLEGLGWTLFRVWSTDWWLNKPGALDKLDAQLHEHLEADRARRQAAEEAAENALHDEPATEEHTDRQDTHEVVEVDENFAEPEALQEETYEPAVAAPMQETGVNPLPQFAQSSLDLEEDGSPFSEHRYVKANLDTGFFAPDPEQFYDTAYEPRLDAMIDHIVDAEGPIHEDVLIRRIARHHGFQRAGRQIRELVDKLARRRRGSTQENVGRFYWRKGTVKDRITPARYVGRDDELRKMEHIAQDEIRAIAAELGSDDPVELARAMGIARLSASARMRLEATLLQG